MRYRLGLDLGTNSIGWAALELNDSNAPISILDTGVRIFSDGRNPKNKEPLAVKRRIARGMRRRRDRFLRRKEVLLKYITKCGLFPILKEEREGLKSLDPYELRKQALDNKLEPFELGRALYHLNQRRGFKSNRKESSKGESKINKPKIVKLGDELALSKSRTLGEFLFNRLSLRSPIRFRAELGLYPDREMYQHEFQEIRKIQEPIQQLTKEQWDKIHSIIFYQRPLKSKKLDIGRCSQFPDEIRAPKASVTFQRYRLLSDLSALRIMDDQGFARDLPKDVKNKIYQELKGKKKLTFDAIRKLISADSTLKFNLEHSKKKDLIGDNVWNILPKEVRKVLEAKELEELDGIIEILTEAENEEEIKQTLKIKGITEDVIQKLCELGWEDFPSGYAHLSFKAMRGAIAIMEEHFCSTTEAFLALKGSDIEKRQMLNDLPYYGEVLISSVTGGTESGKTPEEKFGKIANPTVHIVLNQLRKLVNALVKEYGKPTQAVIEVTRELKLSLEAKAELTKKQNENEKRNEIIIQKIKDLGIASPSREDITKFKLWEELSKDPNNRCCPYNPEKKISAAMIMTDAVEVEHILPFSMTLDDGMANKTVALRESNRLKGNRTPYDAFKDDPDRYARIRDYVMDNGGMPLNKRWRFMPEAMEKFNKENGFIARQLNDTAYISKIAKKYIEFIVPEVWTIPGRLTALTRHSLGLNSILSNGDFKNRGHHGHHAVDAVILALQSRGYLQSAAKLNEKGNSDKIQMPEPWSNFLQEANKKIHEIVISHREDHGKEAAFHEETYYGELKNPSEDQISKGYNLVIRRSVFDLKEKQADAIKDPGLRKKAIQSIHLNRWQDFTEGLIRLGVKKLRIIDKGSMAKKIIHGKENQHHKMVKPDGNHSLDVWKCPNGDIKFTSQTFFDLNKNDLPDKPHPAAKKLFRLHNGDTIAMKDNGKTIYRIVKSISPSNGYISVVPLESTERGADVTKSPYFTSFKARELRRVKITVLGKVDDRHKDIWSE